MSSQSQGLRVLSSATVDGSADIDILLIPGVATPAVDTWRIFSQERLFELLPSSLKSARILSFDYQISLSDSEFSCQDFLLQGDLLLNGILELQSHPDHEARPLLAICHSLGGIVLKQALCIANEQSYRYGSILCAVSGIVFLGTPHAGATNEDTLTSVLNIIAATANLRRPLNIPEARLTRERAMIGQLATRFDGIGLQSPILSVTEGKKTKLRGGFLKSKSILLTDTIICTIDSPQERILTFPVEHAELCHVERAGASSKAQLRLFLSDALKDVRDIVYTRIAALDFKHATTSSYSPVDSEIKFSIGSKDKSGGTAGSSANAAAGSTDPGFEVIPRLNESIPRKPPVSLPCILLETQDPSRVFHGQQHVLDAIGDALSPTNKQGSVSELRQFALCGLGGMGKTEIATEFALRNRSNFDAIFWIEADEPAKIDECFLKISVQLGLETPEEATNQVVSRALVKGWLANPIKGEAPQNEDISSTASGSNDAKWLLIFDNADDPRVLGDYWPEGSGSVLVTSRDPLAKRLYSSRSCGLDLEPLTDDEGGRLVLKLTNLDENPEENDAALSRSISKHLAGLPLAIAQMAGIIRRQELSLSEFLSIYEEREERAALHGTRYTTGANAYSHSIATVWAFEKLSSEAKCLLRLAYSMDPDSIPESVLFNAASRIFDTKSFTKVKFNHARTELLQSSLIRRDQKSNELSEYHISVHRLVQDAIGADMTDEEINEIFGILVNLLWETWPSAMPPPTKASKVLQYTDSDTRYNIGRYPLCAALYPHVLRLKQIWPLAPGSNESVKIRFAALLNDAAWYQHERGRFRGFDGLWDLSQSICESLPGDDSMSVLSSIHFFLGLVYSVTNDSKASREHKETFLALQKSMCESVGPDFVDKRLGLAFTEMAIAYTQYGELDNAIQAYRREMEIREIVGIKGLVSREANYALALILRGEHDLAEKVLLDCVALWKATGSEVSLRIARVFHALGDLRCLHERHDEAYVYHLEAFRVYITSMGIHSQRTAEMRHKLAKHYIRMHRYEEAIEMINAALQSWTYNAEIFKPELTRSTWLKAQLLDKLGKTQKSNLAFKVAGRLRAEVAPNDKRDIRTLTEDDLNASLTFWSR